MAILASLLFFLAVLVTLVVKIQKKANQPPSPFKLPIIGNLHQLGSLPHRSFQALSQKHGPLMLLHLGSVPTLIVSSAEMAKKILKTYDLVFSNRPTSKAANHLFYGCSDLSFAPYGEYWRQMRKLSVLELLSVKRVQSFSFIVEEEVSKMVKEISGSCSTTAINFADMLLSLSYGIISRVAFGKKYTGGGEHGHERIANLAKESTELLAAFSMGDHIPWLGWTDVLTGLNARLKRNSQGLDSFMNHVIDEHLSRTFNDGDCKDEDFVDVLLHMQEDSAGDIISLSRDNIKAVILNMFIGGIDSSTVTLEWAMSELVKNPHVMEKAQAEVRRVVGRKQMVGGRHLLQMDYLKYIIRETLRLHPPVTLIPRESTSGIKIEGYHIPPKTRVLINAWSIGRDPKVWENADEFLPERFSKNPVDFKGQDFQLIPFGTGRRSCPGMSFAISIVELAFANLLYWFDWELPVGINKEDLDMSEALGLSVSKKSALHLVPINHFS